MAIFPCPPVRSSQLFSHPAMTEIPKFFTCPQPKNRILDTPRLHSYLIISSLVTPSRLCSQARGSSVCIFLLRARNLIGIQRLEVLKFRSFYWKIFVFKVYYLVKIFPKSCKIGWLRRNGCSSSCSGRNGRSSGRSAAGWRGVGRAARHWRHGVQHFGFEWFGRNSRWLGCGKDGHWGRATRRRTRRRHCEGRLRRWRRQFLESRDVYPWGRIDWHLKGEEIKRKFDMATTGRHEQSKQRGSTGKGGAKAN